MQTKLTIITLVIIGFAVFVSAVFRDPHNFTQRECSICHIDVENSPVDIKSDITYSCEICHTNYSASQSHPSDVQPTLSIPNDMPLMNGRLTCLTCHYAHVDNNAQYSKKHYFLRRPIRGIIFCSSCHKIDEKRHIVFRNVHKGVYDEMDTTTRIDPMSLECIECHDSYMSGPRDSLGAGRWSHFTRKFAHPIGISYRNATNNKARKFRAEQTLRKEVKLYNGKIGCGTCHNVYSKERAILSMNNTGGRLCTECHIK
jgi:predicted CXXCH cytochrome family protein